MRLFAEWTFFFSNSNEQALSQIGTYRMQEQLKPVVQTILMATSGSAKIAALGTLNIGVTGENTAKAHLLDLSTDGTVTLNITQDAVVRALQIKGTVKLPARVTLSLDASVTALTVVSRLASTSCNVVWASCEYDDVSAASSFPVV